jgi:taurine--2-oxoglutarate transaminase
MGISTAPGAMTGDEIIELTKRHTIFEWSAQAKVDPIPVAGAKGCWFWTPERQALPRFQQPADVYEHRPW